MVNKHIRTKIWLPVETLSVSYQGQTCAKGSYLKLLVMGSGIDLNIAEVLAAFTPKFLQNDIILDANSNQEQSRLISFGCGWERKCNVISICNISL